MPDSRFSPDPLPEADASTIWDRGPHNAFPDVTIFQGDRYGACREGEDHMSYDGRVVVFSEDTGDDWSLEAEFTLDGADLRDPKLSLTPDGQLLCLAIVRWEDNRHERRRSIVWNRDEQGNWSEGRLVGDEGINIWRITWTGQWGYGVGYKTGGDNHVRLYRTRNGREFEIVNTNIYDRDFPNEATLGFGVDGAAYCLLRKNRGENPTGLLGTSAPPYDNWQWTDLGVLLGGPNLTRIPGTEQWLAGGRVTIDNSYTGLLKLDVDQGRLGTLLRFPSEGDHGYPGFAWQDDQLQVVYYSEVEGKTVIRGSTLPKQKLIQTG